MRKTCEILTVVLVLGLTAGGAAAQAHLPEVSAAMGSPAVGPQVDSCTWSRTTAVTAAASHFDPRLDLPAAHDGSAATRESCLLAASWMSGLVAPALEGMPLLLDNVGMPGFAASKCAGAPQVTRANVESFRLRAYAERNAGDVAYAAGRFQSSVRTLPAGIASEAVTGALDSFVADDIADKYRQVSPIALTLTPGAAPRVVLVYKVEQGFARAGGAEIAATRYGIADPACEGAYLVYDAAHGVYRLSPDYARQLKHAGPITGKIEVLRIWAPGTAVAPAHEDLRRQLAGGGWLDRVVLKMLGI